MHDTPISRGTAARSQGGRAWEEARELFQAALQQSPDPEVLEGFATACWFPPRTQEAGGLRGVRTARQNEAPAQG